MKIRKHIEYEKGGNIKLVTTTTTTQSLKEGQKYKFRDHTGSPREGVFSDYHLRLSNGYTWTLFEVTHIEEVV